MKTKNYDGAIEYIRGRDLAREYASAGLSVPVVIADMIHHGERVMDGEDDAE